MKRTTDAGALPWIVISEADQERLADLAMAAMDRLPEVAGLLLGELDRANVVAAGQMPADAVAMGSAVVFREDGGATRRVTLVYPADADIAQGRISVLTPIGAALIGLSVGQSIAWTGRDGRPHRLTVVSAGPAEPASGTPGTR